MGLRNKAEKIWLLGGKKQAVGTWGGEVLKLSLEEGGGRRRIGGGGEVRVVFLFCGCGGDFFHRG